MNGIRTHLLCIFVFFSFFCSDLECLESADSTAYLGSQITLDIPNGWHRENVPMIDGSIAIRNKHTLVWANIYKSIDISLVKGDSRWPRYFAERYSKAWHMPLYYWHDVNGTFLYITENSNSNRQQYQLICSVGSKLAQSSIVIFILHDDRQNKDYLKSALEVVLQLLNTVKDSTTNEVLFPGINKNIKLENIPKIGASDIVPTGIEENIDGYRIKLPDKWIMADLYMPSDFAIEYEMKNVKQIDLYFVEEGYKYSGSMLVEWGKNDEAYSVKIPKYGVVKRKVLSGDLEIVSVTTKGKNGYKTTYGYQSPNIFIRSRILHERKQSDGQFDNLVQGIFTQIIDQSDNRRRIKSVNSLRKKILFIIAGGSIIVICIMFYLLRKNNNINMYIHL